MLVSAANTHTHNAKELAKLQLATSKRGLDTRGIALNALTKKDRKNYTMTMTLSKHILDSCLSPQGYYTAYAKLTNASGDTLKYLDWTCSSDIWYTNQAEVGVMSPYQTMFCGACDKNIEEVRIVPPDQSKTIMVSIYPKGDATAKGVKVKVGMIIQRLIRGEDYGYYFEHFMGQNTSLAHQTRNRIWSNMLELP